MKLLAAAWLALVTLSANASAEEARSRVALVRTAPNDRLLQETSTRLRAELREAGFDVVDVDRAPGDPRFAVEDAATAGIGFATVAIDRSRSEAFADVWISDSVTGKTVVRRIRVRGERNTAAVLAIRAIELLRASLLEAAAPPDGRRMETPPDVMRWVEPQLPDRRKPNDLRSGGAVSAGVLALHGSSGLGFAFGPTLRVSHGIAGPFVGRLVLAGPLATSTLEAPEGTASVRQEFALVDLIWVSMPNPIAVFAGLGTGVFHLHTAGSAGAPYRPKSDDVTSLALGAALGSLVRVGSRVAITAEANALGLMPQPAVIIAGHQVGGAGSPSIGLSAGVMVAF